MKQKIILALLLFNAIGCKSQEKKENLITKQKDTMKHFDKKNYNDLMKNPNFATYGYYFDDAKTKIQVYSNSGGKGYIRRIKKYNSPYVQINSFYENGNLQFEGLQFYVFLVGINKEFDDNGKLIKETNNDLLYKFSIDDLREKLKREYQVDIVSDYKDSDLTLIIVNRWEGYDSDGGIYKKGTPMYQVKLTTKKGIVNLEVNALNGETITEKLNAK